MERIWNALRYGDWETRKCIGSVILFILLGIGLIIAAGLSGHFFLFVLGMLSGAVALMIYQSFDLVDEDFVAEIDSKGTKDTVRSVTVKKDGIVFKNSDVFKLEAEAKKEAALKEEEAKKKAALLSEEKLLQEEIKKEAKAHKTKEKKEKSKKVKEKKERVRKEKQRKEKAEKEPKERKVKEKPVKVPRIKEEKITDKTEKLPKVKEKKIKERIARDILEGEDEKEPKIKEKKVKEKTKKESKVREKKVEETSENEPKEKTRSELIEQEQKVIESPREEIEEEIITEEDQAAVFESYDKQVLVQVKRKYRVKKDHRPILIDNSKTYNIKECPAFIWRVHNKVYLLLLEKEPRKITLSREMIKHVGYAPHVRGNRALEYRAFEKDNLITAVFKDFLPDYYTYKTERGSYRAKNLYYIHPDIQITSRSISQVMDLLYLNFMPSDRITRSDDFNGFFKRIYAANLMFNDKAYTITEYKNAVERVLEELCATEMPEREFNNTLENLVKARFISQEYADHYYRVRSKVKG